jgi:hypothetical protein
MAPDVVLWNMTEMRKLRDLIKESNMNNEDTCCIDVEISVLCDGRFSSGIKWHMVLPHAWQTLEKLNEMPGFKIGSDRRPGIGME